MEDQIIQLAVIIADHLLYFSYRLRLFVRPIQELRLFWGLPADHSIYFFPEGPVVVIAYHIPFLEKGYDKAPVLRKSNNDLDVYHYGT